jgi:hypothetical protein
MTDPTIDAKQRKKESNRKYYEKKKLQEEETTPLLQETEKQQSFVTKDELNEILNKFVQKLKPAKPEEDSDSESECDEEELEQWKQQIVIEARKQWEKEIEKKKSKKKMSIYQAQPTSTSYYDQVKDQMVSTAIAMAVPLALKVVGQQLLQPTQKRQENTSNSGNQPASFF